MVGSRLLLSLLPLLPAALPSTSPSSRTEASSWLTSKPLYSPHSSSTSKTIHNRRVSERERERERERAAMGNYFSKQRPKRPRDTEASSPTTSKRRRREKSVELQAGECESESPHLLPSSDSLEKIDVPSASGANSDPSASSTSVNGNDYYVFLSFRGPDTRNGFVDHLYHRLKDVGLPFHPNFVFRDDENLPFGQKIGENLISAIKHSKVSIPVISEKYAASEWCLREPIQIMECEERGEQKVLPVLYKVKPFEVRELKGPFGEAFVSRKDRFDEKVKQQGLVALRKALDLRVLESEKFANGHEAELIKELVRVIMDEQQHDFLPPLPGNLVGIDHHVAEVMKLADTDPSEIRIIGICGIGGIGKTTLATNVYNKLAKEFEWHSFLIDIKETINRKGMEHIQSLLISDITKNHESRVRDSMMGIGKIRFSCEKKKVLILLDDVGHRDHIDKLIGGCNLESGSIIIITCRDKALLKSEYRSYELKEMNSRDSMLLFSLYAFEAKQPPTNFRILSGDIVATTGGLPLALKIIGSLLKRKDKSIWVEMLENLRNVPHTDVQEKLKISYNALAHNEKQMFLDIACFFIGDDKRFATYLWKDLRLRPDSGLARMIELSLINYDDDNKLRMHDQLRDLGRAIARPEGMQPWLCNRLWGEEAMKVLRHKNDNENIEALHLDERGSREFMNGGSFTKMPNLKFLHLNAVGFAGDFKESLTELRWLKWERCCDSFEATSVHLEKLVVLELSSHEDIRNPISENWRGWSSIKMERLKVLNLSWCSKLKSNPNLSAFENLESLTLKGCANLKEIDPSIQYAKRLLLLNLSGCTSLKMLPEQLGELEHLEELVLDDTQIKEIPPCIGSLKKLKRISVQWFFLLMMKEYSLLEKIPYSIGKLGELVELNLSHTSIKELPESIGKLNKLKILDIYACKIERIPSSIGKLQSLQELVASSCHNLEGQILFDKGGLSSLKILNLNTTKISGLPENLDQLSSLERLDLRWCSELESLPKPPCSLSSLWLTCRSKELPSLSHLKHLQQLYLEDCKSLQSIPSLSHLKHLQELELASCESLQSIPSLSHLERLQRLYLSRCGSLQSIPSLSHLEHLQVLYLESCRSLQSIPSLSHLERLQRLNLCGSLQSIPSLSHLERLQELSLICCRSLQSIPSLSHLERLQALRLSSCESLQSIPSLSHLEHLQALRLSSCESLQEIPELPSCIRRFHVLSCPKVERFPNLSDLENLSGLKLVNCDGLKKLDGLGSLKSLRVLRLRLLSAERVDHLHAIEGLEKLGCLEFVNISRRKHIQVLDLSKSKHLKWLNVDHCESLVEIRCPSKFLKSFDRRGCKSLKKLPDLFVEESNSKKLTQDYEEYLDSMTDD